MQVVRKCLVHLHTMYTYILMQAVYTFMYHSCKEMKDRYGKYIYIYISSLILSCTEGSGESSSMLEYVNTPAHAHIYDAQQAHEPIHRHTRGIHKADCGVFCQEKYNFDTRRYKHACVNMYAFAHMHMAGISRLSKQEESIMTCMRACIHTYIHTYANIHASKHACIHKYIR
jgi:hypothetical protein